MATDRELDDAHAEARLALLKMLAEPEGWPASAIKDVAEAYAWLTASQQPH